MKSTEPEVFILASLGRKSASSRRTPRTVESFSSTSRKGKASVSCSFNRFGNSSPLRDPYYGITEDRLGQSEGLGAQDLKANPSEDRVVDPQRHRRGSLDVALRERRNALHWGKAKSYIADHAETGTLLMPATQHLKTLEAIRASC